MCNKLVSIMALGRIVALILPPLCFLLFTTQIDIVKDLQEGSIAT